MNTELTIHCEDCGVLVTVEAEVFDGTAYWVCPSTYCERTFIDPSKTTEWNG